MGKANKDKPEEKTNVMRIFDGAGIDYTFSVVNGGITNGAEVARRCGKDPASMFKTLVTVGKSGSHYVFMVPVAEELDLKKAARAAEEKSVEMIAQKELLPLTGYVHGGCSPVGMKKPFATFIHQSADTFQAISFSGGRIGLQLQMPLSSLQAVIPVTKIDLIKK